MFPEPVRRYIADGAEAINVPPDMIAVPFLGFTAGVMGNTRAVIVKPGWIERPNLWLAVIGNPGSGKSPALDYARQPLDELQREAWERHRADVTEHEIALAAAKATKGNTEPPPEPPVLEHFFSTDVTTEALASILSTSPGVSVVRDELVGWVKSHDAYRRGGDRQNYLSLWAGAPLKVDRKGTAPLYVPHPCVPIIGGIQPDLLSDLGEEAKRRDGFVERILMVWPTARPIRWNESPIDASAAREVVSIFRRLRLPVTESSVGVIGFDPEARQVFGRWYEENGRITEESQGVASGCYAKYPGQLARIALVLHALRYSSLPHRQIDVQTLADAIAVIEYFRAHLVKILPSFEAMGSTKSAGLATRILRVLDKAGGEWVARRDLSRGLGNSVPADEITTVLDLLEGEGLVENRTIPTGSRPRQESRHLSPNNEHMSKSPSGRSSYRPNNEQMNNSPDDEEEGEEVF
ncbi:MAG: YfjI family protein [Chloroflexota bacterium]|nr:YfjI family protein [Chloroflexota bacterium]